MRPQGPCIEVYAHLGQVHRLIRRMRVSPRVPVTAAALCLLVCTTGVVLLYRSSAPADIDEGSAPSLGVLWTAPVERVSYLTATPDGSFVGVVHPGGEIVCRGPSGSVRWRAVIPGSDALTLSPDGAYALVFTRLDPTARNVIILDSEGNTHWKLVVSGGVWSADACSTDAGARFVVGTGDRHVYVIDVGEKRKRYRRWRAPGAVVSLNIDPTGERVIYGSWQKSAVGRQAVDGKRLWVQDRTSSHLQFVEALHSGDRILVRSRPNAAVSDGELAMLDSSGTVIWSESEDPKLSLSVVCSPDGSYICTGYSREITHEGKSVREDHAVLRDAYGARLWDKGSLFFDPTPLMVTSDGYVVVCAGEKALFTISPGGDLQPAIRLPAAVKQALPTRDESRLVLECADGRLRMLAVEK